MKELLSEINIEAVNKGFGEMAEVYESFQHTNIPVQMMRQKFYKIVLSLLKPPAQILEINCGSGIDAFFFAKNGYDVLATDISDRMLEIARRKENGLNLTFQKLNFNELNKLENKKFDLVISNFGGLNCANDLPELSKNISNLLKDGGYFISTVMPRFSLWEFLLLFKGEFKRSLRRLKKNRIEANVGDEKISVGYYSPSNYYNYFKNNFKFIKINALCVFSPPPTAAYWYNIHPKLYKALFKIDSLLENNFLFSFLGDYYIMVLQKADTLNINFHQ